MSHAAPPADLEVNFRPDQNKAVIEGKTTIPFQAFVKLVLQRKVFSLFKDWGKEPIIVGSELLTSLASAPQDSQESRSSLVLVSMGVGVVLGIFLFAATQIGLMTIDITLGMKELVIVVAAIASLVVIVAFFASMQKKPKSQKFIESMESLSSFLSK